MRDYRKTKGGKNLILFESKLTGHREKFTGKLFAQKWPGFFVMPVCLKSAIISKPLYIRIHNIVIAMFK